MANPQIEDGFLRLANELVYALMKRRISGAEWDVVMAIATKTYGWHKKSEQISLSQLEKLTGHSRRTVAKVTGHLVSSRILGRALGDPRDGFIASTYWIEKDYDKWLDPRALQDTSALKDTTPRAPKGTTSCVDPSALEGTHKRQYKTKQLKTRHFVPPTVEEVRAYCLERNNNIDAESFVAHYETNGWVQGNRGKPIVNWKSAVITWEKKRSQYGDATKVDDGVPAEWKTRR